MEFLYCFANASLTQRVLIYLTKKVGASVDCVTVFFLNDFWVIRLRLDEDIEDNCCENCLAFFDENGLIYRPPTSVLLALKDIDAGCDPTRVMKRRHVAIVSHGMPDPGDVRSFQAQFVAGLGYYPQSLV